MALEFHSTIERPKHDGSAIARAIVSLMPRNPGPNSQYAASTFAIVALLSERRVLTISEIRDALGVPQATASAWVATAVRSTLVKKEREALDVWHNKKKRSDNLDARKVIVTLTPKGHAFLRRARGTT